MRILNPRTYYCTPVPLKSSVFVQKHTVGLHFLMPRPCAR